MKTRTTTSLAVLGAFVVFSLSLQAQEAQTRPDEVKEPPSPPVTESQPAFTMKPMIRFGLGANFDLANHAASNLTLPGVPTCCTGFNGVSSGGFALSGEMGLPIDDRLDILVKLTYMTTSSTMTEDEVTTVRSGNEAVATPFRHTLESDLGFLMLEPGVEWRPTLHVGLVGGLRVGTLMGATYRQEERIVDESLGYTYENGSTVRNTSSGDVQETSSFQFGLLLGARYHVFLTTNGSLQLVPEVFYAPLFTNVVADRSWSVSSFRAGVSLVYTLFSKQETDSPVLPRR